MRRQQLSTAVCCLWMLMLSIAAQAQTVRGSVGIIGKVGHWIDAATGKGIDSSYIEVPERPWQVIAKGIANQSDLHMKSTFDGSQMYQGVVGDVTVEPRIRTAISRSAGLWVGYRGWGIGYSASIGSNKGVDWDIETASASYYVKLRLHSFEGGDFETRMSGYMADPEDETATPEPFEVIQPLYLSSPVKIKTQLLEGVYIFNSSRFSYTAAYDQSVIQRRSAGSLAAGLRYFHSDYDYAHDSNADLILNMNDIGRINTWQLSIGAGYAYNWVPIKGLLVSVLAMPMVTAYNHIKTYSYDSNYRQMALDEVVHSDDELPHEAYRISLMNTDSRNSRIMLNVNSRLSVTYNWSRWFVCANGNFYHSRYHYENNSGHLNDWNAMLRLGVRL
ncbi:MAG: DUF4421 family protein [Prevotella sp.]|nr:DUF4421 family protein [Prevotella sp.]